MNAWKMLWVGSWKGSILKFEPVNFQIIQQCWSSFCLALGAKKDILSSVNTCKNDKTHNVQILSTLHANQKQGRTGKSEGPVRNYELGPSTVAAACECPAKSRRWKCRRHDSCPVWRAATVEAEMIALRSADSIERQWSSGIFPLLWHIWAIVCFVLG